MIDVSMSEKYRVDLTGIDTAEVRVLSDVTLLESAVNQIVVLSRPYVVAATTDLASTTARGNLEGPRCRPGISSLAH